MLLVALGAASMLGTMGIDLLFGVKKAKENGEARTSTGYKKTAAKAQKYFTPFAALVMIDILCCTIIPFPAFSMLWAAYCSFCEFISIREKSWKKAELRKAERTMNVVIENKDDIVKLVGEMMFATHEEQKKEEKK